MNSTPEPQPDGEHVWKGTGIYLLFDSKQEVERCQRCGMYRVRGVMGGEGPCPGKPPYPWDVIGKEE